MSSDPLVLSNTFSKTNARSCILRTIFITAKQEIFLAAKTFQLFARNILNLISTDFKLFLIIRNFTRKLSEMSSFLPTERKHLFHLSSS